MTKKRSIESTESSTASSASKKSVKSRHLTFDEVAAIIQSGDSDKLREVIEYGIVCNVNVLLDEKSLLMVACQRGHIECARVLLDHKADINYGLLSYYSVLQSACLSGNSDMLRFIINRGVTINDQIMSGLISDRKIMRHSLIATILVEYIQDVNHTYNQQSILYQACRGGSMHAATVLLERGARLEDNWYHPLDGAACGGNLEVIKLLLSWYTKEESMPHCRVQKALKSASKFGHMEVVRYLVEYGTDAIALNAALYEAVESNRVEVAAFLLDKGADFYAISDSHYNSWICACYLESVRMVRLFLDRGADPNTTDVRGDSPLKAALCSSRYCPSRQKLIKVLLEHGADPNQPSLDGYTPLLQLALSKGERPHSEYIQAVALLLEFGANPNLAYAGIGETALMSAALDLDVDLVRLLLEHGADVTQVDRAGRSVLNMLGRARKYRQIVELCTNYIECNKPGAKQVLK